MSHPPRLAEKRQLSGRNAETSRPLRHLFVTQKTSTSGARSRAAGCAPWAWRGGAVGVGRGWRHGWGGVRAGARSSSTCPCLGPVRWAGFIVAAGELAAYADSGSAASRPSHRPALRPPRRHRPRHPERTGQHDPPLHHLVASLQLRTTPPRAGPPPKSLRDEEVACPRNGHVDPRGTRPWSRALQAHRTTWVT